MKTLFTEFTITCVLMLSLNTLTAFELPEVIGEFRYDRPLWDFCSIGDINEDGRDDFIVSGESGSSFDVYFGSNDMGSNISWSITPFREYESLRYIYHLGYLAPEYPNCFVTSSLLYIPDGGISTIDFHSTQDVDNDSLWDTWSTEFNVNYLAWNYGKDLRPFDFNGDGFNDLVMNRGVNDSVAALDVYFGGADFDSIPDWTKYFSVFTFSHSAFLWPSVGYDVNNDGYDDILVKGIGRPQGCRIFYALYFGSADNDTTMRFQIWDSSIPGREGVLLDMSDGYSLLPDVNDDGYADFGIYYRGYSPQFDQDYDGIFLFFGGEEINSEPDMILNGALHGRAHEGWLQGGDFNGDGKGDIVASFFNIPPIANGEVHYHFGGADFDTIADVVVTQNNFGGQYELLGYKIGGVGDYNGDGADDIAVGTAGEVPLVVLAGSRAWDLSSSPVEGDPVIHDYSLKAYPNPFNSSVNIQFMLEKAGRYRVDVFDVSGRRTASLHDGELSVGRNALEWKAPAAGVYLVVLSSELPQMAVSKIVALK